MSGGGCLKANRNKAPSCPALMNLEFRHLESSRHSAWAELGSLEAACCPFCTVVPWGGGSTEHNGKGALRLFYSAEFCLLYKCRS